MAVVMNFVSSTAGGQHLDGSDGGGSGCCGGPSSNTNSQLLDGSGGACHPNDRYVLNIRGQRFEMEKALCHGPLAPAARLASLGEQHEAYCKETGEFFFNRDPVLFNCIVSYYVTGKLHFPTSICPSVIRQEVIYWRIPDAATADCCWERLYEDMEVHKTLQRLEDDRKIKTGSGNKVDDKGKPVPQHVSLADKVFWTLEYPQYSQAAMVYGQVSMAVLLVSIVCLVMSTHVPLRDMVYTDGELDARLEANNRTRSYSVLYRFSSPTSWILAIEYTTISFFLVELIIKVVCCCCCCCCDADHDGGGTGAQKHRWRRLITFFTAVDVCIVAPNIAFVFFTMAVGSEELLTSSDYDVAKYVLESLRFLRVFRLLRFVQQVRSLQILVVALKASKRELFILVALVSFMAIIWGSAIFYAEMQTDTFYGIGYGIWWAVVTMTTVGYGDFFPSSGMGYFFGTLCALSGILILALPIPVIANNFNTFYRMFTLLERINIRKKNREAAKMAALKDNAKTNLIVNGDKQEEKTTVTDM